MNVYWSIIQRDLMLAMRSFNQVLNPLLFFVMTISLFPLGVGPEKATLQLIAPGIIWIAALLATLLTLDAVFRTDYEDGSLDLMLLNQEPLPVIVLSKIFAHWLLTGLPLIIISPITCYLLYMDWASTKLLILTLLIGTPILSLIGSIHMALTVGLGRGNLLLTILTIPFYVPVLIFSTMIIDLANNELPIFGHLQLMVAMLLMALALAPLATAMALRISTE